MLPAAPGFGPPAPHPEPPPTFGNASGLGAYPGSVKSAARSSGEDNVAAS